MSTIQIDFEALKSEGWSEQEATNAELIVGFVQRLMNDHEFDRAALEAAVPFVEWHRRPAEFGERCPDFLAEAGLAR